MVTKRHAARGAKERESETAAKCVLQTPKNLPPPGKRIKAPKGQGKRSWLDLFHKRNVPWRGSHLVQGLWNSHCQVGRKSLALTHVSGCVKRQNRYENLAVEEIIDNEDSTATNLISNLPSEGSPSGLSRDDKTVLNSSTKNNNSSEIPDDAYVRSVRPSREINLSIQIVPFTQRQNFTQTDALLDLGANTIFIKKTWVETHKVPLTPLWNPIPVYNVDGTCNSAGRITHSAELVIEFQGHCEKVIAEVTNLGKNPFILGFSWLQRHNPEIDWSKGTVKMTHCPWHCHLLQDKSAFIQKVEEEEYDNQYCAHETIRALEAQQRSQKPKEKTPKELLPEEYHKFLNVISKKESKHMPIWKPWDHTIDLKDMFKPKKGRIIPLLPQEQEEVTVFPDDQLKKGYIRPSKSPQTSLVFFVPKKDGKKCMVQDYWYLNKFTIKNNYPLPLVRQLVDKLQGSKQFTKMDLRWGYNNVWIKEGNEWKAAFICFCGAFKPLVMYFGLCNSPPHSKRWWVKSSQIWVTW